MKLSNKPNIVAGCILLLVAAFFSISLILQALDFGSFGPGRETILYLLGFMLTSVYGFSSILIPVFLFTAAISCFASRWTARKSMRLLTAIVPFFTSVGIEKICRMIMERSIDDFSLLKVGLTAVIGLMLVIIEILAAGMFADRIAGSGIAAQKRQSDTASSLSDDKTEQSESENETDTDSISFDDENDEDHKTENDTVYINEEEISDGPEDAESIEADSDADYSASENSVDSENSADENPYSLAADIKMFASAESEETPQSPLQTVSENDDPFAGVFDDIEENPENPGSIITQEEYAALTDFSDEQEENENTDDSFDDSDSGELEWPAAEEIKAQAGNIVQGEETADSDRENSESEEDAVSEDDILYDDFSLSQSDDNDDYAEEPPAAPDASATLDPDFFDIDMNEETEDESFENSTYDSYQNTDALSSPELKNECDNTLQTERIEEINPYEMHESSLSSDVFDDMEKEIRSELKGTKFTFASPEEHSESQQDKTDSENDFSAGSENLSEEHNAPLRPERNPSSPAVSVPSNRLKPKGPYKIPTTLLDEYENDQYWIIDEQTKSDSLKLKETLNQFNIEAEIIGIKKGPVVTMFELAPAPGVKLSKIVTLQDNIALSLAASSVRIVAPIPGRAAVGIEVPNKHRSIVSFREMIEQELPEFNKMAIPVILGKDILGKSQLLDLVKTPHLLIAGATGAGKSVCVNSMILSILYKRSPQQVKLILVDPKVVELKLYNDIPHLLTPVITEPKRALQSLQYCLCEMERRYALLDGMGVRDISSYNRRIEERNICTEKLPYIVVIIDEFADLMATTGKELESTIARLAAMSRAVGIHLVLATQRPSIDVITGLIKANIPTRIAFMVASKMDSRIIIDQVGAEMLLGKGDMLYASAVDPFPVRIQGTFVSDNDVEKVVDYVKTLDEPEYIDDEIFVDDDDVDLGQTLFSDGADPLYDQALDIVIQAGKASASYIQRRLKIGYNRAARLVEEMEERGIVGPANGSKPREIIHIPS